MKAAYSKQGKNSSLPDRLSAREINRGYNRTQREQPLEYRRLDSLARLVCGAEKCTAVALFNGRLLIASNKGTNQELIQDYMNFLQDIVKDNITEDTIKHNEYLKDKRCYLRNKSIYGKFSSSDNPKIQAEIAKLRKLEESLKETSRKAEKGSKHVEEIKKSLSALEILKNDYEQAYRKRREAGGRDYLKKIERAINMHMRVELSSLAKDDGSKKIKIIEEKIGEIKADIKNAKKERNELYLTKSQIRSKIRELQKELDYKTYKDMAKVLEFLTQSNPLNIPLRTAIAKGYKDLNREQSDSRKYSKGIHAEMRVLQYLHEKTNNIMAIDSTIYIGISKLCCRDCANIMEQLKVVTEVDEKQISQTIETRGDHYNQYPRWPHPPFINYRKYSFILLDEVTEKVGKEKEIHSDSLSGYENTETSETKDCSETRIDFPYPLIIKTPTDMAGEITSTTENSYSYVINTTMQGSTEYLQQPTSVPQNLVRANNNKQNSHVSWTNSVRKQHYYKGASRT